MADPSQIVDDAVDAAYDDAVLAVDVDVADFVVAPVVALVVALVAALVVVVVVVALVDAGEYDCVGVELRLVAGASGVAAGVVFVAAVGYLCCLAFHRPM